MIEFKCNRCHKIFKRKDYLQKHIERKYPCKVVEIENNKNVNPDMVIQTLSNSYPNNIQKNKSNNIIICEYCNKVFAFYSGLSKHKNNLRCKKMNKKDRDNIIAKTNNIVTNNLNNSHNTTNNLNISNSNNNNSNNTINNNISITINPFGKEDVSSITKAEKLKILNKMYLCMPAALKKIHHDIPQNRNVYFANKSDRKFITIFNGKRPIYRKNKKVKDKMCNNIMSHLEEWFNKYQKQFVKNKKKILTELFNSYNNGELETKFFEEIESFLLSYSNDIKKDVDNTILKLKKEQEQLNAANNRGVVGV